MPILFIMNKKNWIISLVLTGVMIGLLMFSGASSSSDTDGGDYNHGYVMPADVTIKPKTIDLASKGKFTAFITPIDGDVANIDIETIKCEGAPAISGHIAGGKLIVKFNIQDLVGVEPGTDVELTVTGKFYDGTSFEGSDTVKVVDGGG